MPKLILNLLLTYVVSLITLFISHFKLLGAFYFYVLSIFMLYDLWKKKKIDLIHIWNLAFGFIILSEVFFGSLEINESALVSLKFLIIANNLIFNGYVTTKTKNCNLYNQSDFGKDRGYFIIFLIFAIFVFIYVVFNYNTVITSISSGRIASSDRVESFFIGSIINALGFVLPSIITYYYVIVKRTKFIFPFILIFPIIAVQFLIGTRFPLLFSLLGIGIVYQSKYSTIKLNLRSLIPLSLAFGLLFFGGRVMKEFRAFGFISERNNSSIELDNKELTKSFHEMVLSFGSPEGVIDMTSLLFQHFDREPHLLGSSSSFILYFWIPRTVWPEKPTMLGHWLVREYRAGFSEGHSTSFGFTGDLFADFGYLALIPVFFIGRLLKIANNLKDSALASKSYEMVLGAMFFPYVFFFVRSPITATMSFIGILFFFYLFRKLILIKA